MKRRAGAVAWLAAAVVMMLVLAACPLGGPPAGEDVPTDDTSADADDGGGGGGGGDGGNGGGGGNGDTDDPSGGDPPDTTAPGAVANVVATAGENEVALSWETPSDADLSAVEVSWAPGQAGAILVDPATTTYTAADLANGTEYTFTLVAVDAYGNRAGGRTVSATPQDATGPANVTDTRVIAGSGQVALLWSNPLVADFDGVQVSWSPGGGSTTVSAETERLGITGLENGTEYTFTLTALDDLGNPAAGVTALQTPTADLPTPSLHQEDDSGAVNTDNVTGVTTDLTLSGTGFPADTLLDVYADGSVQLGSVTTDQHGDWSVDIDLNVGLHQVTAVIPGGGGAGDALWRSGALEIHVTDLMPPRLLRPRNGDNTGTDLTPTFRWEAPEAGQSVEIQADDDPDFGSPDYHWTDLTGESFEPTADMSAATDVPVGTRYYLRIRRFADDGTPGPWSPTGGAAPKRYVNVGRFDGDFNGDGYSDMLVGGPYYGGRGRIYLYFGKSAAFNNGEDWNVTAKGEVDASSTYGYSVAFAGDVNADGFADILAGAPTHVDGGRVYLYPGSESPGSGITNGYSQIITAPTSGTAFGVEVAGAGDVDADGFADFLIGAFEDGGAANPDASGFLYRGGSDGAAADPVGTLVAETHLPAETQLSVTESTSGQGRFVAVGGVGDVDGDGYGDFLVASPSANQNDGLIRIFHGSAQVAANPLPDLTIYGVTDERLGTSAAGAGDFNGDGYDDFLSGTNFPGIQKDSAYIFQGGPDMDGQPDLYLENPADLPHWSDEFGDYGIAVAPIGDRNNDGYDDVAVGAPTTQAAQFPNIGVVTYFYGGAARTGQSTNWFQGWNRDELVGHALASSGDINGDGRDDTIVGAHLAVTGDGNGRIYLDYGQPTGIDAAFAAPEGATGEHIGFSMGAGR